MEKWRQAEHDVMDQLTRPGRGGGDTAGTRWRREDSDCQEEHSGLQPQVVGNL